MDEELADVRWVLNSKYRIYVMEHLSTGISYPKQIKEAYDIRYPNVSRALGELRDRKMVEIVADEHPGRLYEMTEYGEQVWERIKEEELV
ncbi:ArsR family transcriptional regulator [Haloferax sp. AB510]|uniref:ArsR family transcriptional regulator n=1 Tax=Haloferax sp. AB510 TaxID=2934172 RepID=UPI00209BEE66|nr:ArsR family transcriptional regulator [Haloferax sp. AB510]MCO8267449.1 ArsR family transcriptional regulator [Haloferax sp. AB510]